MGRSVPTVWRRRGVVLRYVFFWQSLQNIGTALEIWIALYFLHAPISLARAVVFESLIQAVSSAAFFVPAGLGVQEGGFVLLGGALGLDPATSLALAGAPGVRSVCERVQLELKTAMQFAGAADIAALNKSYVSRV